MKTEEEITVTKDGTARADSAHQVPEEVLQEAAQEAVLREVQEVVLPEEETRAVLQDLQAQAADLQEEAGEILREVHRADLREAVHQATVAVAVPVAEATEEVHGKDILSSEISTLQAVAVHVQEAVLQEVPKVEAPEVVLREAEARAAVLPAVAEEETVTK